jgi:hypothetical protein
MTTLMHIPLVHDTFPIHFDKLAMDFGRANAFRVQKSITERTSQLAGLVIDMVLYNLQKHPVNDLRGQGAQMFLTLQMHYVCQILFCLCKQ